MLLEVEQHIAEDVARLRRRSQIPAVVAVRPERARSPNQLVDAPCDADLEARNPTRDAALVRSLDDEMHVIVLNREVDDLEVLGLPVG